LKPRVLRKNKKRVSSPYLPGLPGKLNVGGPSSLEVKKKRDAVFQRRGDKGKIGMGGEEGRGSKRGPSLFPRVFCTAFSIQTRTAREHNEKTMVKFGRKRREEKRGSHFFEERF